MANLKKGSTYDGYTIVSKKDLALLAPKAISLQTGGTNNGNFVKIATVTLTWQYAVTSSYIDVVGGDNGGGTYQSGTIFFRVKQQNALGGAPIVDLDIRNPVSMSAADVVAVLSKNDSTATVVDLYVRINFTYEILQANFSNFRYFPYMKPCNYSQFFSTLPTGTQFPCTLRDGVFNNLTMGGKTVLNTDHLSATDPHTMYSKKSIGYTVNSAGTSGQYALIGTATITAQFQLAEAFIQFMSGASGNNATQRGLLHFRVKQQAAMGSAPIIEMWLMNSNNFSPADVVAIVTSNTSNQTVVQLYAKINNTFEELYFNTFQELTLGVRSSITIVWSTQAALIASVGSLPTGTQTNAAYQTHVLSGTTASRPTVGIYVGMPFFDTTLGKQISVKQVSPAIWVDGTGTTV